MMYQKISGICKAHFLNGGTNVYLSALLFILLPLIFFTYVHIKLEGVRCMQIGGPC